MGLILLSLSSMEKTPLGSNGRFLGQTLHRDIPSQNHSRSPFSTPETKISISVGARTPADLVLLGLLVSISPGGERKLSFLTALLFCCSGNEFLQRFMP